jgi:two-component system, sensor histidine kinase and response regulator
LFQSTGHFQSTPRSPEEEIGDAIPADDAEPLAHSVLEGLRELQQEGEPDILSELIALFLEDTLLQFVALRETLKNEDAQSVERIAHTLKGSCGNMGALRMATLCAELQEVGSYGDLALALGLLDQLEAEFERVRTALAAILS